MVPTSSITRGNAKLLCHIFNQVWGLLFPLKQILFQKELDVFYKWDNNVVSFNNYLKKKKKHLYFFKRNYNTQHTLRYTIIRVRSLSKKGETKKIFFKKKTNRRYRQNINISPLTLTTTLEFWCNGKVFNMISEKPRFNSHPVRN